MHYNMHLSHLTSKKKISTFYYPYYITEYLMKYEQWFMSNVIESKEIKETDNIFFEFIL